MPSSRESRIAALPADVQAALRARLAGRAQATPVDTIPAVHRDGPLPLSFPQQLLWFLDEFQPGDPGYNSAVALRLTGPLSTGALAAALRALVRRHEALRTTFDTVDGRAVQSIRADAEVDVPVTEVSAQALPEALRAAYEQP